MPIQKGKRRKRPRHRVSGAEGDQSRTPSATPPRQSGSRPARPARKRWKPPLAVNLAVGLGMLVFGAVFFARPDSHMSTVSRLALLIGYLVVAGFYLVTAYRQYRERRGT